MKKVIPISVIGILLVVAGVKLVIMYLEKTAPVAEKKETVETIPVVEVTTVQLGDVDLPLSSEGLVVAMRETILSAQVGGRITQVHPDFEIGGTFRAGDLIAQIDQVNYRTAVAQAEAALANARLALKQEEARGEQAIRDWKKIGGGKPASEMVLRIPFLENAKAQVVSAQAMLAKAVEDLDRTRILAPFDCRVRETNLDLGAMIGVGARLGMVYDPTQYIVHLPFALADFAQFPEDADVTVETTIAGKVYTWKADVMWNQGDIDRSTLSAYVIVKIIPNADAPERFQLPLSGLFVQARVAGAKLSQVIAIPRSAVRGRDQIAVMNDKDELEFRTLKIVRSSADQVYVTGGVKDGERVILTKMELPVVGMKLALTKKKP